MRNVVVFFSYSGNSRRTAEHLAGVLEADLIEIVERKPRRRSVSGYWRGIFDSGFRRKPEILPTRSILPDERVILCAPIWVGRLCGPVRTWLSEQQSRITALVWVPHSGFLTAWPRAIEEIAAFIGHRPDAMMGIGARDVYSGNAEIKAAEFAARLRKI